MKESLTQADKDFILANYLTKSLIELTREITGDKDADGRSSIGKEIKFFVASQGGKVKSTVYEKLSPLELTQEQKEFIDNNLDKMRPTEMARTIFNNPLITPIMREYKVVLAYCESKHSDKFKATIEEKYVEEYEIPQNREEVIAIVNKEVENPKDISKPLYDKNKLNAQEEKNLRYLLSYLRTTRFKYEVNQYQKEMDRDLFVSTVVRYLHDKPETMQEEIDQYIFLAAQIVTCAQIERQIQIQQRAADDSWERDKKLSTNLVEQIKAMREDANEIRKSVKSLYKELTGSRSARLKDKVEKNSSILNLVEAWQNEKTRNELIALAELQQKAEEAELTKLSSMDSVISLIGGLSTDQLLYTK